MSYEVVDEGLVATQYAYVWNDIDDLKETTLRILKRTEVDITFIKKDGTIRTIRGTLNPDHDISYEKKTERTKEPNPNVQPVYDVEAQAWRSFTWDTVTKVTFS